MPYNWGRSRGPGPEWLCNPKAREFFRRECELMAERYPQFRPALSTCEPGAIAWRGLLCTNLGGRHVIEAVNAPSYPHVEPAVFVVEPALRAGAPHLYSGGRLCLHAGRWTPFRSTAAAVISATAEWLLLYDHWLATGEVW